MNNRSPWRKQRNVGFSCKDCTERHVGCHTTCEKYKAEKAEHEAKHEAEYKERLERRIANDYIIESIEKLRSRRRSKK